MPDDIGIMARKAPRRTSAASLWLGIVAVVLAVSGAYGAGAGLWPFPIGLLMVAAAFLAGVIAGLAGFFAAIRNPQASGFGRRIAIGLLLSGVVLIAIGPWIYRGVHFPPIHDVTTDLANPPGFNVIPPRKDNLAGVQTLERWRTLHRAAYADIAPIKIEMTPDKVIGLANTLAAERGWVISPSAAGRIEATATGSPFRFKDDIVVVATANIDGRSSTVNMRSVSRVGVSDFGINAERVREFLRALKKR